MNNFYSIPFRIAIDVAGKQVNDLSVDPIIRYSNDIKAGQRFLTEDCPKCGGERFMVVIKPSYSPRIFSQPFHTNPCDVAAELLARHHRMSKAEAIRIIMSHSPGVPIDFSTAKAQRESYERDPAAWDPFLKELMLPYLDTTKLAEAFEKMMGLVWDIRNLATVRRKFEETTTDDTGYKPCYRNYDDMYPEQGGRYIGADHQQQFVGFLRAWKLNQVKS